MKSIRASTQGSTLLIALSLLLITTVIVGVAMTATNQQGRIAKRDQDFTSAQAAADGALEYAYASWKDIIRGNGLRPPTNNQLGSSNLPPPTGSLHAGIQRKGITFSNFSVVNANQWGETVDSTGTMITDPVGVTVTNVPGYPGWSGTASFYRAHVTASAPTFNQAVNADVSRYFQVTGVPILQAAIFFEYDIELHPGPPMIINGLVHTNSDLWAATSAANILRFNSNVSYVGDYHEGYRPNTTFGGGNVAPSTAYSPNWSDGLPSSTSTSYATQLSQVTRLDPYGSEPASLFNTTDTNRNNDSMREIIEPPDTTQTDPPEIAATRFYNQAGLRITIDRSLPAGNPNRIQIRDGKNLPLPGGATDAAIRNAINVSTTPIYDWREGENVYLSNVDTRALSTALSAIGTTFNGVLYIQDVTTTGKNAIRLQNGAVLSGDLTVVSNNGIYVQGDFNTGGVNASGTHDPLLVPSNNGGNPTNTDSPTASGYEKKSCAIAADAVMILSNNWQDANSNLSLSSRVASHTTVNAAILGGIVPTNTNGSGSYSGGPHNFPRFLETWSNKDLTYWGSMVQLYFSQLFDGIYDTGNIYAPPGRRWNWDAQLFKKPPPGLFRNLQYTRGRWERS